MMAGHLRHVWRWTVAGSASLGNGKSSDADRGNQHTRGERDVLHRDPEKDVVEWFVVTSMQCANRSTDRPARVLPTCTI
nr:hypothetical protein CFP56_19266 [Quercus suber]POE93258.1 hypothetical protein CFP56_19270 [Quercus suber]